MIKLLVLALIFFSATSISNGSNLVSLTYDDGSAEDGVWIDDLRGHAVVFNAPCDNWTLSEVAILGRLTPEPKSDNFVIEVWNDNFSQISKTMDRSKSFFSDNFTWAVIDIPDAKVSGSFVVSFYEFAGVYLGADVGNASGQSIITARNPNRIMNWSVENHTWNETNWMIRAVGSSPGPIIDLQVLSDKASQSSPAKVDVEAQDADGNLESATLYIVDNKTKDIVWSEVKKLESGAASVEFTWPGIMFQISADGLNEGPVFAVNNIGISENLSTMLAYSAPCILEIEENRTVSALAYFAEDGKLNALIDALGSTYYIAQDLFRETRPGEQYHEYINNNITIVGNKSKIGFLKIGVPSSQEIIGPITLSGSPLSGYELNLQRVSAGTGDYIAVVQVEDTGLNAVRDVSAKVIKIV